MGKDYVFAASRVRSLEGRLLTSEQLRSMTESKKPDDIFKVLNDAGYGSEGSAITASNYEELLKEEELVVMNELRELTDDDVSLKVFQYQADYHNIKVLLKAEALGVDRTDILMHQGSIDAEDMKSFIAERNMQELTPNMAAAIDEAVSVHARTKDPQYIDFICDTYCFKDIDEAAQKSKNDFVKGYTALLIDTVNIKTFARLKKMKQPKKLFEQLFIKGGSINETVYLPAYDEELKQSVSHFEAYEIYQALEEGIASVESNGTFTAFEKKCDDILMDYAKNAKFETFGIEPIFAYMISKQTEIKCIRILLTGKLAGMNPELIRERLRETYE